MGKLTYYLIYPLLWLISILPFPLFYLLSDFVYFLVYYLIGYRKEVVKSNLKLCFPNKTAKELKRIEKAFYHHMCDMFLEMVKTLTISEKQLKKRFVYKNVEEFRRFEENSPGVIVMCGHYASYEWATAINYYDTKNKGYAIYKKLKNEYFDQLIKDIRANLGTTLINSKEVIPTMLQNKRDSEKASYYMISDQSPKRSKIKAWTNFMGVETPVFTGSEAMAKKLDFAVLYLKVEKVKRGFYEATFSPLAENPKEFENFKITEAFFTKLEEQIKNQPEYYLWTHKRWKFNKKDF